MFEYMKIIIIIKLNINLWDPVIWLVFSFG